MQFRDARANRSRERSARSDRAGTVNKYSSFRGPTGIRAVPARGLYVDCERGPYGIDIHMYIGARGNARGEAAERSDNSPYAVQEHRRASQPSTNGRGHAINKPRN